MLLMSLGASKSLRRWWLLGTTFLFVLSCLGIYHYSLHEIEWAAAAKARGAESDIHDLWIFVLWIAFLTSLVGYFYWVIAHILRFFGKHVKDDYQDNELFER
jgi:hypothetical protein